MNVCAGSWLICSVCIERTMQMSSAMSPISGRRVEISWPDFPWRAKGCWGPKHLSAWPWSWAIGWPFVKDSGIGSPCRFSSSGFQSNSSRCDGPPAW